MPAFSMGAVHTSVGRRRGQAREVGAGGGQGPELRQPQRRAGHLRCSGAAPGRVRGVLWRFRGAAAIHFRGAGGACQAGAVRLLAALSRWAHERAGGGPAPPHSTPCPQSPAACNLSPFPFRGTGAGGARLLSSGPASSRTHANGREPVGRAGFGGRRGSDGEPRRWRGGRRRGGRRRARGALRAAAQGPANPPATLKAPRGRPPRRPRPPLRAAPWRAAARRSPRPGGPREAS
jgi:hypothetical protein